MRQVQVTSWIIPLVGHQFDLEDLPYWLDGHDVLVALRDDTFVLVIPASVIGEDYKSVRKYAEEQLQLINGIGRLFSSSFQPLSLSGKIFGLDADGTTTQTIIALGTAEYQEKPGTMRAILGGNIQSDPRTGTAMPLIKAATISRQAKDALIIVSRPILTWSELYLLFELVQSDIGGKMFEIGWISKDDAELFTHTANSYNSLRTNGRHGKDRGVPPHKPMELYTAEKLIRNLVLNWLQHKGTSINPNKTG